MSRYRTAEYSHLLLAERAIAAEIEAPKEDSNLASLSAALVRVIDQKRIMRGQGSPKPVDARNADKQRGKRTHAPGQALLLDVQPVGEHASTHAPIVGSVQVNTTLDAQPPMSTHDTPPAS